MPRSYLRQLFTIQPSRSNNPFLYRPNSLIRPSVTSSRKFADGFIAIGAVHKVRHAIFGQFWPPSPCHTLSHIPGTPRKYVTHLGSPPIFSRPSTKIPNKSPLYKFSLNCSRGFLSGGFCQGVFCLEGFVRGCFLSIPPSVRIHLLQQKGKHHFKFQVSYVGLWQKNV